MTPFRVSLSGGTRGSLDAELLSEINVELDTTPVGGNAKCSFKAKTERKARNLLHTSELKTKAGDLYKTRLSVNEKGAGEWVLPLLSKAVVYKMVVDFRSSVLRSN